MTFEAQVLGAFWSGFCFLAGLAMGWLFWRRQR